MGAFYFDNAIAWAQFRVKGGWKNLLIIGGAYALVIVGLIVLTYEVSSPYAQNRTLQSWAHGMLILQASVLGIFAAIRISAAIRQDLATRRIESHRLMPISPHQAVAGYIVGGTSQMLCLGILNFIIGGALSLMVGIPIGNWLMANIMLGIFCLFLWAVMALSAFVSRAIFWIVLGIFFSASISQGVLFGVAPGLLLMCGPMVGKTIFDFGYGIADLSTPLLLSVAAQGCLILLCIYGAARKFVRDDAIAMPVWAGLALLMIWASVSLFGLTHYDDVLPRIVWQPDIDPAAQAIGSVAASMLVGLVAVGSFAWTRITRAKAATPGDGVRRAPTLLFTMTICTLLAILPAFFSPPHDYPWHQLALLAVVVANFFLFIYLLMRLLYPRLRRANLLLIVIIGAWWCLPLLADTVYYSVMDIIDPKLDCFSSFSPLGTMIQIYTDYQTTTIGGVGFQVAVLVLAAVMYFNRRAKPVKSEGEIPATVVQVVENVVAEPI